LAAIVLDEPDRIIVDPRQAGVDDGGFFMCFAGMFAGCPCRKLDPAGARPEIGRCFVPWRTCSN
jgi:hypothetical protein